MLLHLRKVFSPTSVCQRWTPAGNFVQNWSRLSNYLMFLNIICYIHYLLLFMISLDHPCEIENGVLQYTFCFCDNFCISHSSVLMISIFLTWINISQLLLFISSRLDWISFFLDFCFVSFVKLCFESLNIV